MPVFLFWNVNRKRLDDRVARIVRRHAVDVVVLAEYDYDAVELTIRLSEGSRTPFRCVSPPGSLVVFTRTPGRAWDLLDQSAHWQVYRMRLRRAGPVVLFAAVHLRSRLHTDPGTQRNSASQLARLLAAEERKRNAVGTVLVGDLNMNPFDEGVAGADALNAVSTRAKAGEGTRTVDGREHPLFYNPMWGMFGDRVESRPPGTYYRSAGRQVNYFWNVFDQVLLRPTVMDWLRDVSVLRTDGAESLLTPAGLPDATAGSDHLPIQFTLHAPDGTP